MASTIKLKNGSGEPLASDLVQGEPALDLTNKRLYTEDSGGTVIEVGTNPTELQVDNINIDGNAITSTNTDGDITITPNGTGTVVIDTDLDVDNININGNAITSTDTDGNITITPNGTGEVDISKVDIDSGAIDNTVIGGTTTAAGSFTTLQADTSLNVDGTVTADGLTVDTDTLYVDATNNRVGVGTTSPNRPLQVAMNNAGATVFSVKNDGAVNAQIGFQGSGSANDANCRIGVASDTDFVVITGNSESLRVDDSGNVGINTSPQAFAKLQVKTATDRNISVFDNANGATICAINDLGGSVTTRIAGAPIVMTGGGGSGSEHVRIDSSGNVGINETDPDATLHSNGTTILGTGDWPTSSIGLSGARTGVLSSTENGVLLIANTDGTVAANKGAEVFMGATATTDTANAALAKIGGFKENSTSGNFQSYLKFTVTNSVGSGVEAARFNSSGNLAFPNGQGIDFSASEGAGATSSVLDDYEEGTWTPNVFGSSTSGTYTLSNLIAFYTKIGNQVTCWASFGFSAASGGSGDFRLDGLPFNYKSNSAICSSPRISQVNTGQPSAINIVMNQASGGSDDELSLVAILDNASRVFVPISGISTSSSMIINLTYTVN